MFENRTYEIRFLTIAEKTREFDEALPTLMTAISEWYVEESEAIDGEIIAGAPAGDGGSIVSKMQAIDSKRVLDASAITQEVLGIDIPPEIIKPGGYASVDELTSDLLPKLRKVYTGEIKVKNRKTKRTMVRV